MRLAKGSDGAFIRDLSKLVFSRYGPYEDMLSGWLESDTTITLLAVIKNRPAGFAMLGRHPYKGDFLPVAELLAIAVKPSKQNCGVGNFLMNEIIREAMKRRIEMLVLHTALEILYQVKFLLLLDEITTLLELTVMLLEMEIVFLISQERVLDITIQPINLMQ